MMILITAFTILHVAFYLKLAFGWKQIPKTQSDGEFIPFSIVVPVRNEEHHIGRILGRLESQDYPKELFEVIVVDDFSDDQTVSIVQKLQKTLTANVKLIQLEDLSKQGKKHALTAAINEAKYETILTTDADCWFDSGWIKAYNNAFTEAINMVAGPVALQGDGLFARLQQVEFAGLMGFGAVTIAHENPSMCSGANLGFRKHAFQEVGGYTNNLFTPSGDDEFLLYNIMRNFPNSTLFLKDSNAIVNTPAHSELRSFINQRTRWTSKWKHNKNWRVRLSAVLFFFDYLIFYSAIGLGLVGWQDPISLAAVVGLRFLALFIYVAPINKFLRGKGSFWSLFVFQIIYPMHVLFMGMNSIFGSYTWKGRKYG